MSNVIVLPTKREQIDAHVRRIFELAGGVDNFIKPGETILLKPNFIAPKAADTGATTDLLLVETLLKIIREHDADPIIAEGVPYSFKAGETFGRLRVDRLAKKYGAALVNLDTCPARTVSIPGAYVIKSIPIAGIIFEVDKIINLPVMKTHTQTTVTLGMKNLMGCIPGKEKLRLHSAGISEGIVDINTVIKPAFTIIDGIVGMEGNGPTNGTPKNMRLLTASDDILALEITTARIMGFDPYAVRHIYLAQNKNIGEYDANKITVKGADIETVRRSFSLPILKINKWLGPLFLGKLLPLLARGGVRIDHLAQNFSNYLRPYPRFRGQCEGCSKCLVNCPRRAIRYHGDKNPAVDKKRCIKCYVCDEVCIYHNIYIQGKK